MKDFDKKQLEQKVKAAVAAKLDMSIDEVEMQSDLWGDLGTDSLDRVEIVMRLEQELGIELPDIEYSVRTVGDLAEICIEKVREQIVCLSVKNVIMEVLCVSEDRLSPSVDIFDKLGADSLDLGDIVANLEKEFDISIPDQEVENLRTVADFQHCCFSKLTEKKIDS